MKTIRFILTLALLFSFPLLHAQKKGKITFDYVTVNIIEGYDHDARLVVYVDGKKIATSGVHKESERKQFTVKVKRGNHKIRAVVETFYEGEWQEHIFDNEYSTDSVYEGELNVKKKQTVTMKMDISTEETKIEVK
ncbi:MAG: hypothetical protein ACOZCO_13805 [Bacteroidota bacterium]